MPRAAKPLPSPSPFNPAQAALLRTPLLEWYKGHARPLPWRATTEPYKIWLAEIMLQQTTVAAVIPYYTRFLERFPTLQSLAAAPIADVLHLWQGLGYYRRAHLLHRCAQQLMHQGGEWPRSIEGLRALPGFGAYTAGAVASCAYNLPALAIDGNVVRVISRMLALNETVTPAHPNIIATTQAISLGAPPRALTNALMELGSQICTPKAPKCLLCPWQAQCAAHQQGRPMAYPLKPTKAARPMKHGVAYVLRDRGGNIWLQQRPPEGLLGGLWELPHTGWEAHAPALPTLPEHMHECGTITHVFTHFTLVLEVRRAEVDIIPASHAFMPNALPPISTLMKKALRCAALKGENKT
jgi:A/G-specific adenine glycosylase